MRAALAKFSHFRVDQFSRFLGSLNASTILLLLSIALCSYLLPTVIEREAWASRTSTWGLILFFGDLVGCSLLSLGLRLKKTGVFVYGLLKGGELYLSTLRLVSRHTLIWLMDLAPTFIVVSVILFTLYRSQGAAAETGEARPG